MAASKREIEASSGTNLAYLQINICHQCEYSAKVSTLPSARKQFHRARLFPFRFSAGLRTPVCAGTQAPPGAFLSARFPLRARAATAAFGRFLKRNRPPVFGPSIFRELPLCFQRLCAIRRAVWKAPRMPFEPINGHLPRVPAGRLTCL